MPATFIVGDLVEGIRGSHKNHRISSYYAMKQKKPEPGPVADFRSLARVKKAVIFAVCLGILLFGTQELILRIIFPVPEILNFRRLDYSRQARSGQYLPSMAHSTLWWWSGPDGASFARRTNLYEFHDQEWRVKKRAGTTRIAFVGDSFVEGLGAPDDGSIPEAFARLASTGGLAVETLNLGAGGFGWREYLPLIRDATQLFKPDHLMLLIYMNDAYDLPEPDSLSQPPLVPKRARFWAPRILHVLKKKKLDGRVPRRWQNNTGSEPKPLAVGARLKADPHLVKNIERFVQPELAAAMHAGSLNPAITNLLLRSERFLPASINVTPLISALAAYFAEHGTRLWVVYIPSLNQVSDAYLTEQLKISAPIAAASLTDERFQQHSRDLASACQTAQIPYLDLTPTLRATEKKDQRLYWPYDGHMKAKGYSVVAETIFDWWNGNDH